MNRDARGRYLPRRMRGLSGNATPWVGAALAFAAVFGLLRWWL